MDAVKFEKAEKNEIEEFYNKDCDESQRLLTQSGQIEFITTMKYL